MKLKPSARQKRRYLLIEAKSKESVEKAVLDYVGVLGWARASPFFVSEKGEEIIVAINREELDEIRAAFGLAGIKTIRVSGTIKGLSK